MIELKQQPIEVVEKKGDKKPKKEDVEEPQQKQEQLTINEVNELLEECYEGIKNVYRKYLDLNEDYYDIIPLWVIGSYFHESFESFPYLFFNA